MVDQGGELLQALSAEYDLFDDRQVARQVKSIQHMCCLGHQIT